MFKSRSAREVGSIAGTVGINPRECHSGIFVGLLQYCYTYCSNANGMRSLAVPFSEKGTQKLCWYSFFFVLKMRILNRKILLIVKFFEIQKTAGTFFENAQIFGLNR